MWEEWLFKTIIAFISIRILIFVFKDVLKVYDNKQDSTKKVGKSRGIMNSLLLSAIPFVRWIFVGLVLFLVFMAPTHKKQLEKEGKENE